MKDMTLHSEPVSIEITCEFDVAKAALLARSMAAANGFTKIHCHQIATSVSELATNLLLHTERGGQITLSILYDEQTVIMEVVAEDDGPGIPDIEAAMRDGFSTSGTLGGGLPGVQRLMHELEITTQVGHGTRVVARRRHPCK